MTRFNISRLIRRMWNDPRLDMPSRFAIKIGIDLSLWTAAIPLAFLLRLEEAWTSYLQEMALLAILAVPLHALVLHWLGFYRRSWHKLGLRDLFALGAGVAVVTVLLEAFVLIVESGIPRSVPLISAMVALFALGSVRLLARVSFEESGRREAIASNRATRVLIAGAGEAGTMLVREMLRSPEAGRIPVGFLDDDPQKRSQSLMGLKVLGPIDFLPQAVLGWDVDEVLIAMPSQPGNVVRRVVELARVARVTHRMIPGVSELLSGKVSISQIRKVDYEDLLRREPVRLDLGMIASCVDHRVILVTGAGGSIGSEIVRQLARFEPAAIIMLDRAEASTFAIDIEMRDRYPELRRHAVLCDVCDPEALEHVFAEFRPDVVFHAAAYKHVPLMEEQPWRAVANNVGGTRHVARLSLKYRVGRFVNVSTDKAVNPTSIMGASKRVGEMIVSAASRKVTDEQAFVSVRFGNVLGSQGSVVPLFKKQIRDGGPVTVTHPEMTRYFMTIAEAAQLVLQSGSIAENGNVYLLDMGQPIKIVDLAKDLILLSGLRVGADVDITYTGIRPGEKLYEELLTAEEGTTASNHEKIFVAKNHVALHPGLEYLLDQLAEAAAEQDEGSLRRLLTQLIPMNRFDEVRSFGSIHIQG